MLKQFIERPVLATVISSLLVILGVIGLLNLPLERFPDIAPPAVQVTAFYPGANAETILRSVAPSLEEAINGVEDMTYLSSTASNDGSLIISVFFKSGTNADQAAVNVQNRVSQATSQLPSEVVQRGIATTKQQNGLIMVPSIYSEAGDRYDQTFLTNYVNINLIPDLKRIPGIGQAVILGGSNDYAMRLWLKPGQLAAYHLTPTEVLTAIQDQNLEAAPGKLGESSNEAFEYVLKYAGKLNKPADFEDFVIRANADGSVLRLRDVARVEFGAANYVSQTRINGKPGISIIISQLSGSNANEIQIQIGKLLEKASRSYPKGIHNAMIYNSKGALDASIAQVEHTLLEAFVLVFIVVFLFLQDFRSTLIPAIAVPVAIVGTFFFMQLFGFTINLLTLFALVLAIGIVVDDAIVVVEAVHAKMEHQHLAPKPATLAAMHEITGAIISITLIMSAVFLPIGLMKGPTGLFYRQFAFTLAIAIVISAVNALTLSPALCALLLKDLHPRHDAGSPAPRTLKERFFLAFNTGFTTLTDRYVGGLRGLVRRKWWSLGALAVVAGATAFMLQRTPTGFIPNEDIGVLGIATSMPAGASLQRMQHLTDSYYKAVRDMPQVQTVNAVSGFNLLTLSTSPSAAIVFMTLRPEAERGPVSSIPAIKALAQARLNAVSGGTAFVFEIPSITGFGNIEGLDVVLQDRTGSGQLGKFSTVANGFIGELMKRPEIAVAFTTFNASYPQYNVEVNKLKAKQLGVSVRDVLQTMQTYFGSVQASDFNRFGKYYRVIAQADIADRRDPAALNAVFVPNSRGDMLPLSTLVQLKRVYGPETASRYNLFNAISVTVMPKLGFSTGDAIRAVSEVSKTALPAGYTQEFSGLTREQINSGGQSVLVFSLCLVFVYFLLAAQYESYILPWAVLLSIPTGIFGVFVAIGLAGIENNIYVQVALIMLIGLLAKNAILIVEFAVQRRAAGLPLVEAALEAARLRLRPIIMTSLAFIVGITPMMRATGPSANGNHSISISAAGGMLSGVLLGLFIIPVLFVVFQALQEKISGKPVAAIPAEEALSLV